MIWRWERMFHGAKCQKARWNWFHPVWGHIYLLNAYLFVRQGHIVGPFLRHEFCPVVSRSPWAMKRCYRFSRRSDLGCMGFNWYKFSKAINKGFDFGTSFDHLSAELFLICRFCCGCPQSKISMCVLPFFKFHFADIVGAGKNNLRIQYFPFDKMMFLAATLWVVFCICFPSVAGQVTRRVVSDIFLSCFKDAWLEGFCWI